MRCFIAIELPDELKRELGRLEAQLQSGGASQVKWVDPAGIHLTLKFLGNVSADRLDGIAAAMEAATRGITSFGLKLKELGVFPNSKRVQVVWVGVSGDLDALSRLQQRTEANLAPLGFAPEKRPFVPHLTLARVRDQATPIERQRLGQLIADTGFESKQTIEVNAVSLIKSQLTPQGAIYSRISSVELGKADK